MILSFLGAIRMKRLYEFDKLDDGSMILKNEDGSAAMRLLVLTKGKYLSEYTWWKSDIVNGKRVISDESFTVTAPSHLENDFRNTSAIGMNEVFDHIHYNTKTKGRLIYCIRNLPAVPCELCPGSHINGVTMDSDDFGESVDKDPLYDDYGCGCKRFESARSSEKILDKYHINEEEYNFLADLLEEELSPGPCSWCS
jgi:hypothetical protein